LYGRKAIRKKLRVIGRNSTAIRSFLRHAFYIFKEKV
jgi:hypothetical protein